MPNRIVREGINDSNRIDGLVRDAGWAADAFFRRLLNAADDYGRFDARLTVLKAKCYPTLSDMVRDNDLQRWIAACEKAGLVRIYSADSKAVGEILNFRQAKRAEKSRFPGFEDATHMRSDCVADATPLRSYAESYSETKAQSGGVPPGFARFWTAWPHHFRKKGRSKCLEAWKKRKLESLADRIVSAVEQHKSSDPQWAKNGGQFIPGPMPWLNDEGWEAPCDSEPDDDRDSPGFVRRDPLEILRAAGLEPAP